MKTFILPLLGIALSLGSCVEEKFQETLYHTTLQASIDQVSAAEVGTSSIDYNSKTGENFVIYTEVRMGGWATTANSNDLFRESIDKAAADEAPSGFGLRYGLEYIGKGARFPGPDNVSINLNYLAVPLDVMYHYPLGAGSLEGGLGPYFAYGIGGKTRGISSFGQDNGGFKRFDAGLNLSAGYQLNSGWSFRLVYELGLANVEYADEDVKGHTRAFGLNVGYEIGRLFKK